MLARCRRQAAADKVPRAWVMMSARPAFLPRTALPDRARLSFGETGFRSSIVGPEGVSGGSVMLPWRPDETGDVKDDGKCESRLREIFPDV